MNKCSEDDEPEEILSFYNEARTQAQAGNLPELKDCAQVLAVTRRSGVKIKMQGAELEAA